MKKVWCLILCIGFLMASSCSYLVEEPFSFETSEEFFFSSEEKKKEWTEEEKLILESRREAVVSYMNQMASILWRCEADVAYSLISGITPEEDPGGTASSPTKLFLQKGRLYRGLPYTYGGNGIESFLAYSSQTDENGVAVLSDLPWQSLGGGSATACVGNDCSTAVMKAWGSIGSDVHVGNTGSMCAAHGYLPVGEYQVSSLALTSTKTDCTKNGKKVMYASYAALQKGDAVVRRNNGSGHAMLVTGVFFVMTENGIDEKNSYITVTHQTRGKYTQDAHYYDEALGENVWYWYGIDDRYSFSSLFQSGYLPITCKELIDPSPIAEPEVRDSCKVQAADRLFEGTISSNRMIERVCAEILDSSGRTVQEACLSPTRKEKYSFPCKNFEESASVIGRVDPSLLSEGSYRFVLTVCLSDGQRLTAREVSFTR